MADMQEVPPTTIECGFCLRHDMALSNPRQLTCSHVHCLKCLDGFYEENHMLVCPLENCREVCRTPLAELPSYDISKHQSRSCDVCLKTGEDNLPALAYCPQCDKLYCANHHKLHEDYHKAIGEDHQTIDMEQYEVLKATHQSRFCAEHCDKPISLGCKICLNMICNDCVSSARNCKKKGESHKLMSLRQLVESLNEEINKLKKGMIEREEGLERLFKFTSQTIAEYDQETIEMVKKIHDKRDEQMESLLLKYQQLEDELREARNKVKVKFTDFLDDEVRAKWSQLRNLRRSAETRTKHAHECDVVSGFSDTKKDIQKLVDDTLPSLDIPVISRVRDKDSSCEVMLKVVSSDGFIIDEQLKLRPSKPLPKSIRLIQTISLLASPYSVRVWDSQILSGLNNKQVVTINSNYQVAGTFFTFNNHPGAMDVYKDKLYTAVCGNPWTICVHDQQGKQLTSWTHNDYGFQYTGLAVTSNKVVAPNRNNKLLIIYSLTGNKINEVSCPCLSQSYVSLCASGSDKVVVSDYSSSQVCMVDISQGQQIWTCTSVPNPQGVASYGERYVLVAASSSNTVRVLNSSTGEIVSELTDSAIGGGSAFDLHTSGDRLLVANFNSSNIAVFDLLP